MREARARQRRRRLHLLAALLGTLAVGVVVYAFVGRDGGSVVGVGQQPRPTQSAAGVTTLRLRLVGFGKPIPTQIDTAPCPQGRTVIRINSSAGARIGSVQGCVLAISQAKTRTGALSQIKQTARETYRLPGGTIVTHERQMIHFSSDQHHTTSVFQGRVLGGSGRYAHLRGTVSGGGPGLDGKANWLVTIELR